MKKIILSSIFLLIFFSLKAIDEMPELCRAQYYRNYNIAVNPGEVIYVDLNAYNPQGNYDGSDWPHAIPNLHEALIIAKVKGACRIYVAEGTYFVTDSNFGFLIDFDIKIYGGFNAATNKRNPEIYKTVLSGELGTVGLLSDNAEHVITIQNVSSYTVIDGFTIQHGYAYYSGAGGGIYNKEGDPTISNCILKENWARLSGGGMYSIKGSPNISKCAFVDNESPKTGGGLRFDGHSTSGDYLCTVTNCFFLRNKAPEGGGLYSKYDASLVINSTFYLNNGNIGGGIFQHNQGHLTVTNSIFWKNIADTTSIWNPDIAIPYALACNVAIIKSIMGDFDCTFGMTCVNILKEDPMMVNITEYGYDLESGSPAIDKGMPVTTPVDDLKGNFRPKNYMSDIGAIEYQGPFVPIEFCDREYAWNFQRDADIQFITPEDPSSGKINSTGLVLYPNPTKDNLTVHLDDFFGQKIEINIYNGLAQLIWHESKKSLRNPVIEIKLDHINLPDGIYTIQVNGGTRTQSKQFVISK